MTPSYKPNTFQLSEILEVRLSPPSPFLFLDLAGQGATSVLICKMSYILDALIKA